MAAKSKPVDTVTAADLGVAPVGWAGAGQQIVDVADAPERQAGEIIEDDGEALHQDRRVPRRAQGHLRRSDRTMAVSNIWVFAEGAEGAPTSTTLELLTKARAARCGGGVTAFVAGDAAEHRRGPRRVRRDEGLRHRRSRRRAARRRRRGGDEGRDRRRRLARPDPVPAGLRRPRRGQPAVACSSTARCSRTTSTSPSTATPSRRRRRCSAARKLVTTTFTGAGPHLVAVRPKSFAAEPAGGAAPEVVAAPVPDLGADGRGEGRRHARRGAPRSQARRGRHRRRPVAAASARRRSTR